MAGIAARITAIAVCTSSDPSTYGTNARLANVSRSCAVHRICVPPTTRSPRRSSTPPANNQTNSTRHTKPSASAIPGQPMLSCSSGAPAVPRIGQVCQTDVVLDVHGAIDVSDQRGDAGRSIVDVSKGSIALSAHGTVGSTRLTCIAV
ncbi:hypothetical protein [Microbacterium sp. AK031]|uniref:hypothetical protein n=1 Tax=Microbacterium sp. AK031 TaxID=2723076 RepID=UPI00216AA483|nr:hypothetical protein [Microbacterium sp. AK031]MCS3843041.1 hypothetical protein [Microbacterium sp. AK031]